VITAGEILMSAVRRSVTRGGAGFTGVMPVVLVIVAAGLITAGCGTSQASAPSAKRAPIVLNSDGHGVTVGESRADVLLRSLGR